MINGTAYSCTVGSYWAEKCVKSRHDPKRMDSPILVETRWRPEVLGGGADFGTTVTRREGPGFVLPCSAKLLTPLEHPKIGIDIYIPNQSPSKGSVPR